MHMPHDPTTWPSLLALCALLAPGLAGCPEQDDDTGDDDAADDDDDAADDDTAGDAPATWTFHDGGPDCGAVRSAVWVEYVMGSVGYTDHWLHMTTTPVTCQDWIDYNLGVQQAWATCDEDLDAAGDDPQAQCLAFQTYYQSIAALTDVIQPAGSCLGMINIEEVAPGTFTSSYGSTPTPGTFYGSVVDAGANEYQPLADLFGDCSQINTEEQLDALVEAQSDVFPHPDVPYWEIVQGTLEITEAESALVGAATGLELFEPMSDSGATWDLEFEAERCTFYE